MSNDLEAPNGRREFLVRVEDPEIFSHGEIEGGRVVADPVPGVVFDSPTAASMRYLTPALAVPFPADIVVPSWNVVCPEGARFDFHVRVGRGTEWSPWFHLGFWGTGGPPADPLRSDADWGEVDVDFIWTRRTFDRVQMEVVLRTGGGGSGAPRAAIRRLAFAASGPDGDPEDAPSEHPRPQSAWNRRLPVPFRSQYWEDPEIAGSICSPTSVAMVLAGYGVEAPTADVVALAYDPDHGIYGNWSRAVQTAYVFGVPGWLERFPDWWSVRTRTAEGRPVVASIRARPGELAGAPYRQSAGHLLVITGFDGPDRVHVNDPAAREEQDGVTTYAAADLETVWLRRSRLGYVFLPPEEGLPGGGKQ